MISTSVEQLRICLVLNLNWAQTNTHFVGFEIRGSKQGASSAWNLTVLDDHALGRRLGLVVMMLGRLRWSVFVFNREGHEQTGQGWMMVGHGDGVGEASWGLVMS